MPRAGLFERDGNADDLCGPAVGVRIMAGDWSGYGMIEMMCNVK